MLFRSSAASRFSRFAAFIASGRITPTTLPKWAATALRVDAFLTGEISEQHVHLARESGVAFVAAGHHATERYGVQALAAHLAERFGIACEYVDIDNPV